MLVLYPRQRGNQHSIDWVDELLHRSHKKNRASGIKAHCSGPEKSSNQKAVGAPGKGVHQGSGSNIRAETQQAQGFRAPGR